jgi:hypothetical protein
MLFGKLVGHWQHVSTAVHHLTISRRYSDSNLPTISYRNAKDKSKPFLNFEQIAEI